MSAIRHATRHSLAGMPRGHAHGRTDGPTDGRGTYFRRDMTLSNAREKGQE
jgi:hypothetical protein